MIPNRGRDDFDRLMAGWMLAEARVMPPGGLVDGALARTRTARRRPRWLVAEWWLPVQRAARLKAAWQPALLFLILAALAVATAVYVILAGAQRQRLPAPFGVAANGRLVADTNGSLVVVDTGGGGARPLVEGIKLAAGATFSRDGTRIVFWGDDSPDTLYVANADGSGVRKLAGDLWISTDKSPAWSPDGRYVALSTESGPNRSDEHLVVVDAASGVVSTIRAPELDGIRALLPAWSPDGAWIAFVGIARDEPGGQPSYWLVHPDGSGTNRLPTSTLAGDTTIAPHWAPDPAHLRLAYSALAAPGQPTAADVFDLATNRETRMSTGEEGLWPAWSPDATTLAWLTNEATGDVRIVPADGATTSRTIPRTGIARPPAWSPDGRFIYGLDDRRTTVIVIAVDGSAPAVGIPHAPSQGLPDWQRAIAP